MTDPSLRHAGESHVSDSTSDLGTQRARRVVMRGPFWSRVQRVDRCWIWMGYIYRRSGYGYWLVGKRRIMVHRVAYQLAKGPIPDGLTIDHLCRNRACVNPDHLEPVTDVVNVMRGFGPPANNARKTHCINGHEYTQENTRLWMQKNNRTRRSCRECSKERMRRIRAQDAGGMVLGVRTVCKNGHQTGGKRICKECVRLNWRNGYWRSYRFKQRGRRLKRKDTASMPT